MSEREYPVPDFPGYFVREDGSIVSYLKSDKGIELKTHAPTRRPGKSRSRNTRLIRMTNAKGRWAGTVHKVVVSAKYGKWPEPHEEVRHMDGNHTNNSMSNLQLGDHLNNIIDDIERGDRQTSAEQLDLAIARLMSIREKLE